MTRGASRLEPPCSLRSRGLQGQHRSCDETHSRLRPPSEQALTGPGSLRSPGHQTSRIRAVRRESRFLTTPLGRERVLSRDQGKNRAAVLYGPGGLKGRGGLREPRTFKHRSAARSAGGPRDRSRPRAFCPFAVSIPPLESAPRAFWVLAVSIPTPESAPRAFLGIGGLDSDSESAPRAFYVLVLRVVVAGDLETFAALTVAIPIPDESSVFS